MKNKLSNLILIIIILLLSLFIVFFSINYLDTDKKVVKSGKEIKQSSSNKLALMLETGPASGEYQVSTDSTWPATGYDFNPTLSKCENGSTLTYDIVIKKVKVQSNKSDKCFVYFDKEILPIINSITESNVTASAFTLTVNATAGTKSIKTYYYSKDNGASYVTSSSNSYTFSGLLDGTAYNIKIKAEDIGGSFSDISSKKVTTIRLKIAEACVGQNMASCIKSHYIADGMDYHDRNCANTAQDQSYRFSGANPNNYVCFGPGATSVGIACPEENQYRIIGVFGNQVKLIKKTRLSSFKWNASNNTWAGSTMDTYLNGEYLNSLTSTWSNKIASNTWQVGGMTYDYGVRGIPYAIYMFELGDRSANIIFNGKIGLMYVSDYGFAAQPQAWTLRLGGSQDNVYDYSNPIAKENNWLFHNYYQWTISRNKDTTDRVFWISIGGHVNDNPVDRGYDFHPSFYLESSINLIGGNGTSTDPYRV